MNWFRQVMSPPLKHEKKLNELLDEKFAEIERRVAELERKVNNDR